MAAVHPARVLDLGRRGYAEVLAMQRELLVARQRHEIPDTLLLVEHDDVVTLGRAAKPESRPAGDAIPVVEIERGGDVTYHGPGQLVGYPIFFLRRDEQDVRRYVGRLEEAIIRAVADLGVAAGRRDGHPGVWTRGAPLRKLASIGVAIKKWVTMHGFALNVSTNLTRFAAIRPCGFDATVMTSIARERGADVALADARARVAHHVLEVFGRAVS